MKINYACIFTVLLLSVNGVNGFIPIAMAIYGAVVAAPVYLPAIGFTAGGIAAGSTAAGLMSASAITGVGGPAVAIAQSVGAAGLAVGTKTLAGAAVAARDNNEMEEVITNEE
ncbi:unnamed protein product [Owenia fusiformis]|uniref:Uncharacterized protein n=1 Tax=Owenia fusiformis TaxID=6347 RepID=A0A8S4PYY2_OWEFU|nr:unnamed protein product [Owenia fusiformis]